MYKPKIFLIGEGEGKLIALEETGYVTEDVLQGLLANYPDLLAGDQIDPENPRRWLLVAREMRIPGDSDEGGRWSLDHLFLDQDGVPTFVECKRATDTRIRREVVAQMLDYAANGIEYWSMDQIRQAAAETARGRGRFLDAEIAALLGNGAEADEVNVEDFWNSVEGNLHNRRIRLVFVADSTPKELRRLVEFLNEEMKNVEVLAIEVKQFRKAENEGQTALVPRVVGFTEAARSEKGSSQGRKARTNRDIFLGKSDPGAREFFERLLDTAEKRGHYVYWGQLGFSVRAHLPQGGGLASFMYGYPPSTFHFYFDRNLGFTDEESATLRSTLLEFGVFQESGQYTLTAEVKESNLEQIERVCAFIFDRMGRLGDSSGTAGNQ